MRFPPAIAAAVVGSATWSLLLGPSLVVAQSSYSLVKSYEGSTFFDDWEYYGYYDNLTKYGPFLISEDAKQADSLLLLSTVAT